MKVTSNIKHVIRAINNVQQEVKRQSQDILKMSSIEYMLAIQSAIKNQTYADASWIYSPWYKEYKRKKAPNKPYWMLSNDLFNSIQNKRISSTERFVGIPKGKRNKEGYEISEYALKMEFGDGGKHRERPVWRPTLTVYFEGKFQKRVDRSIREILVKWKA